MAFIGIKIAEDISRLFRHLEIPGDKVPENEQHVTIVCFEDDWKIKDICKAMEAAYEALEDVKPFKIKTSKITCFPRFEDNPVPIIAKIESAELGDVNKKLKAAFDDADVAYNNNYKNYKPHITLAYAEEEIDDLRFAPLEFTVTEIVLWSGADGDDKAFITFPLKGIDVKKHSKLTNKVKIFNKLAIG
jgi:2'-5' RNA ligase